MLSDLWRIYHSQVYLHIIRICLQFLFPISKQPPMKIQSTINHIWALGKQNQLHLHYFASSHFCLFFSNSLICRQLFRSHFLFSQKRCCSGHLPATAAILPVGLKGILQPSFLGLSQGTIFQQSGCYLMYLCSPSDFAIYYIVFMFSSFIIKVPSSQQDKYQAHLSSTSSKIDFS